MYSCSVALYIFECLRGITVWDYGARDPVFNPVYISRSIIYDTFEWRGQRNSNGGILAA